MFGNSVQWRSLRARVRVPLTASLLSVALLSAALSVALAFGGATAAGSTDASVSVSSTTPTPGSCAGIPGPNHARLVVETNAGKVVARCVGFSGSSVPGLKLLKESHVEFSTQAFSFGVAICQVDDIPAHYMKCLPTGQDYWALFLSTNGRTWTSPSVGVSDIKVPPGGSLGLRYDSPKGTPAPPPRPTPA
jgi:hypothetical protein